MANIIIAVLPDALSARHAVQELLDGGFRTGDVHVISSENKESFRPLASSLPHGKADSISNRIDGGECLVIANPATDAQADVARRILQAHERRPGAAEGPARVAVHDFSGHSVLALYESPFQAEAAVDDLHTNGFPRSVIRIISKYNKADFAHYAGAVGIGAAFATSDLEEVHPDARSSFVAQLGKLGVPEEEGRWYSEQLERGMYLVALTTEDRSRGDEAAEILKRRLEEPGEADGKGAASFGHELSRRPRYRGRRWYDVEMEIRGYWEARYPGTWEKYGDDVREGYESGRRALAA